MSHPTASRGGTGGKGAWIVLSCPQTFLVKNFGVALMYGKIKENREKGQKFSDWVQEMFPGLCIKNDVPAAIWFASDFPHSEEIPAGMSNPRCIRAWFNEQQTTQALPSDLQEITPESALLLPQRDAERVAKVVHRSTSGGKLILWCHRPEPLEPR